MHHHPVAQKEGRKRTAWAPGQPPKIVSVRLENVVGPPQCQALAGWPEPKPGVTKVSGLPAMLNPATHRGRGLAGEPRCHCHLRPAPWPRGFGPVAPPTKEYEPPTEARHTSGGPKRMRRRRGLRGPETCGADGATAETAHVRICWPGIENCRTAKRQQQPNKRTDKQTEECQQKAGKTLGFCCLASTTENLLNAF